MNDYSFRENTCLYKIFYDKDSSTDFKADFVGFVQKPYKVGFFAYIDTFYEWRSIELTQNKNSYDSRNNTGGSKNCAVKLHALACGMEQKAYAAAGSRVQG